MNSEIIDFWDWMIAPFYILIIFTVGSYIKNIHIKKNPIYKYFLWGIFAKIVGAISVCLIYIYYYKTGGDTLDYHLSGITLVNLLLESPANFLKVWLGPLTPENFSYFNNNTGFPYYWGDSNAFGVVRLIAPLELLAFNSYIITAVLMAVVSFSGIWKLYLMFCELYPRLHKQFAIAILFVPSVIFWGSGILKDSWTLSAACWFCYSFYGIILRRKDVFFNTITIFIASFIMILIKPYIFVALLPGTILWGIWNKIVMIKNILYKIIIIPLIFAVGIGGGVGIWLVISKNLGQYSSMESMLIKAKSSSDDLKQGYYQGNSFDIGSFEPTIPGILSKFPVATLAGLFRPFLWEAKNIVMLVSAFENMIILSWTMYVFLRKPVSAFTKLFSNPIVMFCLIFSVFFAFSVGLSTSNFGALVRLRIPLFPFYLSALVIIEYAGKWKLHK